MNGFILIEGVAIPAPSKCVYEFIDLSSENSGRGTRDGLNHKDIIAQKRKLSCTWDSLRVDDASFLAKKAKKSGPEFSMQYFDITDNAERTSKFTSGDFSCEYGTAWLPYNKVVQNVSCNFIEK